MSRIEEIIAERVKECRQARNLTAADLAARTGLSKAMISKIESASTSSSLNTLERLAEGLGVPVTALFRGADSDREAIFTPASGGSIAVRSGTAHGHQYTLLGALRGVEPGMEPTLVTLTEASAVFPTFQHPGAEFIYMLEGRMTYGHGEYSYPMQRGDSLLFDGEGPHGPLELIEVPIRFLSVGQQRHAH